MAGRKRAQVAAAAVVEEEEDNLTIDDIARRYAGGPEDVPSPHYPEKGNHPKLGPVIMTFDEPEIPDQSDDRIRSLEDLMARFPFRGPDGEYFVRVVRKAPKVWQGMHCTGVLRKIVHQLKYEQFVDQYGGGEYELTVYGPPRSGGAVIDASTGRPMPKALTRPIEFIVPYDRDGIHGMAPNPEASIPEQDEAYTTEAPMPMQAAAARPHPFNNPRRPTTPADAKIHESDLEHEREREAREQTRLERERVLREAEQIAAGSVEVEKMRLEERRKEREMQLQREREEAQRARADRLEERWMEQQKQQGQPTDIAGIIQAMASMRGDDGALRLEMQRAAESHKAEVTRILEDHKREVQHIEESARRDQERQAQLHAEQMRLARDETQRERERSDRMIKDAEERAEKKVKDAEERWERERDSLRREHERQIQVSERMWESRLADERRNAERDMTSRQTTYDVVARTEKTTFETQLRAKDDEISRLRADVDKLRGEVEAKGDVVQQVARVTEVAEALGFTRAEGGGGEEASAGPGDWRGMLAGLGVNLVQQLPDLIRSAGDTIQGLRRSPAPAAAQDAPMTPAMMAPVGGPPMMPARQHMLFSGESSDVSAPAMSVVPIPQQYMEQQYMPQPQPQQYMPQPQQYMPQPQPQQYMPQPQPQQPQQRAAQQQPQRRRPQPQQPPAPPEPEVAEDEEEQDLPDEVVLSMRTEMEAAFEQGASADDFVQAALSQLQSQGVPLQLVQVYAKKLTAERFLEAMQDQGITTGPFVRFDGKQWLREFEQALQRATT